MMLNKSRSGLEEKFFTMSEKVVAEEGYVLYDMEYNQASSTVQVFIMDKNTGSAIIEDCVKIDRAMSPYFEQETWIPEDITLEVSSPGVYRALKTHKHFKNVLGQYILCSLQEKIADANAPKNLLKVKKVRGKLLSFDNEILKMDVDGYELKLSFKQIKKASLDADSLSK